MAVAHIDPRASHLGAAGEQQVVVRPWLAQYDAGVPTTIDYPSLRLDGLLARAASAYPHGRECVGAAGGPRAGETADGLPLVVQVIGGRYREDLSLDAAQAIEDRLGLLPPIDPR